ncbi:MAG: site-specific integrase, partial [Bacteroidota bacterium]
MLWRTFETYLKFEKGASLHTLQAYRRDLHQLADFLKELAEVDLFEAAGVQAVRHTWLREWMV